MSPSIVIARRVRAIQSFFNLDYRDTPGNDIRRHFGLRRYDGGLGR